MLIARCINIGPKKADAGEEEEGEGEEEREEGK